MSQPPDPDQETRRAGPESGRARLGRSRWPSLGLAVVGACALLLTVSFALSQRATGRVMAGVRVGELDVSRLTREDVRARLDAWAVQRAGTTFTFSLAGAALTFEPKSAGFRVDLDGVADHALAVGRDGAAPTRFASFVARFFRARVVPITLGFDAARLTQVLSDWQTSKVTDPP